ncbi:hypothetical protein AGMMS49992_29950 [Clostridia bacterium]|nr:hypothetical protein AGMMS49992_29950 [Clostridia bacterium]
MPRLIIDAGFFDLTEGIPAKDVKLINKELKKFARNPSECDFKKLSGRKDEYRLRQGNYRIIMVKEGELYFIKNIDTRGNVYEGM